MKKKKKHVGSEGSEDVRAHIKYNAKYSIVMNYDTIIVVFWINRLETHFETLAILQRNYLSTPHNV